MNTIDWTQFSNKIPVKAELSKLYDAWTKASELEKWFLSKAEFTNPDGNPIGKDTSVQKGNQYAWNWHLYPLTEFGKITEANGKDYIQFTFAGDCLVDIHLKQINNQVIVELCQKNIPGDEESKYKIRVGCDTGWTFFLANLKAVYEHGIDLRNMDRDLPGMINN